MSSPRVHGLLVTHGRLGTALLDVVEHLLGAQSGLTAISNIDLSTEALSERIAAVLDALAPDTSILLFTDLAGGSCDSVCRIATRRRRNCRSVSGVNLPMLLEFCHYRDRLPVDSLVERIMMKAQASVRLSEHVNGKSS